MGSHSESSLLERAYARIREQKLRIEQLSIRRDDPIAIVGYACRFPGGAVDGDSFWKVLCSGSDAFSTIDDRRWPIARHFDPEGRIQGRSYTLAAGLVDDIDRFDARFFNIPAIEAEALDPQQRLLLEVGWHALEDAGLDPARLRGSSTGVFVGVTTDDYSRLHARSTLPVTTYTGLGSAKSMAAGRLSYFFDFQGPALQLDTTCSSALVAVHLAARELREGSCDLALVGAANAIVSPDTAAGFCEMKALSRRGQLRAFDDAADGYVRGEGCGMFVLKRLGDATRDGDRIHALLLGSAMNHDGRTNGLTAPNRAAQERVIRRALESAGCTPEDIQYVEAHGTGTKLGDLIEAGGLGAAHEGRRSRLRIGSVKANIGHLEAASGAASLVKVILGLRHGRIPGQVNFVQPNSRIDWAGFKLEVSADDWQWPTGPRRAGVSAFGMSGTNVHLILGEPPATGVSGRAGIDSPPLLFVSARSETAMRARLDQFAELCARSDAAQLGAIAAASRESMQFGEFRHATLLRDPQASAASLRSVAAASCRVPADRESRGTVIVFSGQGTQYPGMALAPYRSWPAFRTAFDQCATVFTRETGRDLVAICCDPGLGDELERAANVQAALVAMGIALHAQWQSLGVRADLVIGHSVGEFAAAVAVGSLSLEQAMRMACARGKATALAAPPGAMFAVVGSAAAIDRILAALPDGVHVAAINSARQITLACSLELADAVPGLASGHGARALRLSMSSAFHSPAMAAAARHFESEIRSETLAEPRLPWIRTAGTRSDVASTRDPGYFARQMLEPVAFADAVELALARGGRNFIEIGPASVLAASVRAIAADVDGAVAASLRPEVDAGTALDESISRLYAAGLEFDVPATAGSAAGASLPLYPFDRQRHWLRLPPTPAEPLRTGFDLRQVGADAGHLAWEVQLGLRMQPHLEQHRLFGVVVVAGASWIALCLQVARRALGNVPVEVASLKFLRPLTLADADQPTLRVDCAGLGADAFRVSARLGDVVHFEAEIRALPATAVAAAPAPASGVDAEGPGIDFGRFYENFSELGYTLGPAFRWMTGGRDYPHASHRRLSRPQLPPDAEAYELFPGLIDSCFHALASLLRKDATLAEGSEIVVPAEVRRIRFHRGNPVSRSFDVTAARSNLDSGPLCGDLLLRDGGSGDLLLEIEGLGFRKVSSAMVGKYGEDAALVRSCVRRWTAADCANDEAQGMTAVIAIGARAGQVAFERFADLPRLLLTSTSGERAESGDDDSRDLGAFLSSLPTGSRVLALGPVPSSDAGTEGIVSAALDWAGALCGMAESGAARGLNFVAALPTAEPPGAGYAALLALLRSAAAEHRSMELLILDGEMAAVSRFVREGCKPASGIGELRFLDGEWRAPVLCDAKSELRPPLDLSDGVVLVTGGSGALSTHIAAWLQANGAQEILMLSRSGRPAECSASGFPAVQWQRCDVADEEAVGEVFKQIRAAGKEVIAVVHAAGVLADRPLSRLVAADLRSALAPKLAGAMNLARHWRPESLRLVLALSSLASLAGSAAQAAYAAANGALDQWIGQLRQDGLPASVLNLGPVNAGMAARLDERQQQRLGRSGLRLLPVEQLDRALSQALAQPAGQLVVFAASESAGNAGPAPVAGDPSLPIAAESVVQELCAATAGLMGIDGTALSPDDSFGQLGIDSLLAAELSAWIQTRYQIGFSMDAVLAQRNLREVAVRVLSLLGTGGVNRAAEPKPEVEWAEGEL